MYNKTILLLGISILILIFSCNDALHDVALDDYRIGQPDDPVLSPDELIGDKDFSDVSLDFTWDDYWYFWRDTSAIATVSRDTTDFVVSPASGKIVVTQTGDHWGSVQLQPRYFPIKAGSWYYFSFNARASTNMTLGPISFISTAGGGYVCDYVGDNTPDLTDTWKEYSMYIKSNNTDNNAAITFLLGDISVAPYEFYIDNLSLREVVENAP